MFGETSKLFLLETLSDLNARHNDNDHNKSTFKTIDRLCHVDFKAR